MLTMVQCAIPTDLFCRYILLVHVLCVNLIHSILFSIKQFLYGEDGLDICKSQFLNDKGIPFLVANRDCVRLIEPVSDESEQKEVDHAKKLVIF